MYFFVSEHLYWGLGDFLTPKFPRLQNTEPCSKLQYGNDHMSVYTLSNITVYLCLVIRLMVPYFHELFDSEVCAFVVYPVNYNWLNLQKCSCASVDDWQGRDCQISKISQLLFGCPPNNV